MNDLTNIVVATSENGVELLCADCAPRVYGDVAGVELEPRYTWENNETDTPNHCGYCATNPVLLEEDLTPDGVVLLRDAIVEQLTTHGYLVWPLDVQYDRWKYELELDAPALVGADGVDFGSDGIDDRDAVLAGYLDTLLWTGRFAWLADGATEPLVEDCVLDSFAGVDDLPKTVVDAARETVHGFLDEVEQYAPLFPNLHHIGPLTMGHDIVLTAGRHGAGFWDEGLGKLGEYLTHAAHVFGGDMGLSGSVVVKDATLPDPLLLGRENMDMSTLAVWSE